MAKNSEQLTAYCMATKTKGVPMKNIVIKKSGNRFFATGDDGKGHKMSAVVGETRATELLESGVATKGDGWDGQLKTKKVK